MICKFSPFFLIIRGYTEQKLHLFCKTNNQQFANKIKFKKKRILVEKIFIIHEHTFAN